MKKHGEGIRVLLLYMSAVTGHRQAAEAIRRTLKELYPKLEVKRKSLFQYGNPLIVCLLNSLYLTMIKLVPWFWDLIWDSKEVYWLSYGLRNFLYRTNSLRLYKELILPFHPQVVICTHNVACALCSVIKKEKKSNFLLAAVPTDFCLHPYWFYKNVDMYLLSHEGLNKTLIKEGVNPDKIQVTGIPIFPNFSKSKDGQKLKRKWGLKEDLFTILLMGGGQGIGSLKEIVLTLDNSELPIQLLVVTGINRRLRRGLRKIQPRLKLPLKILSYVREIDELMEISDLLISKPGGLTTAEALVKELPLGIVDSLAGQERRNREILLRKRIAFQLKDKEDIIDLIQDFLNNSFDLGDWRKRVKNLARPKAAQDIARKIMSLVKEKLG